MATQGPPKPPGDPPGGSTLDPPPAPTGPINIEVTTPVRDPRPQVGDGPVPLWVAIRNRRTDFSSYASFVREAYSITTRPATVEQLTRTAVIAQGDITDASCFQTGWHGLQAYELLKTATECFLLLECGVSINEHGEATDRIPGAESTRLRGNLSIANLRTVLTQYLIQHLGGQRLPYIHKVVESLSDQTLEDLPLRDGLLRSRVECPCLLELIWSYWAEEGMVVQGLNALSLRFQNRRLSNERDPLAQLDLSPLRPLSAILWGYVQDEQHRLSLQRRNYEYEHQYGISLRGKAVPAGFRVSDRRPQFMNAFNHLLTACAQFFARSENTQVNPDPFPLLNALKEVHLQLSQGASNQFGDLPWTARVEMLMQQWILARPEIREFLGRRPMVAYPEEWMGNVESLKTVMGWADTSIVHFRNLAVFGEQLLLSIRWHAWADESDPSAARDWANYFRPELQGYMHAYRVATLVDLATDPKDSRDSADRNESPSALLERRRAEQRRRSTGAATP